MMMPNTFGTCATSPCRGGLSDFGHLGVQRGEPALDGRGGESARKLRGKVPDQDAQPVDDAGHGIHGFGQLPPDQRGDADDESDGATHEKRKYDPHRRQPGHVPVDEPVDDGAQEIREYQASQDRCNVGTEKEQHHERGEQEDHQVDGLLVREVLVDPAADDFEEAHRESAVFLLQQVEVTAVLLP